MKLQPPQSDIKINVNVLIIVFPKNGGRALFCGTARSDELGGFCAGFKFRVAVVMFDAFLFGLGGNLRQGFGMHLLQMGDMIIDQAGIRIGRGRHAGEWIVGAGGRERQDAANVGRGGVTFGQRRQAETLFDGLEH